MPVRVRRTGRRFGRVASVGLMRDIGSGLRLRIQRRTAAGVSVTGESFQPLSPGYAAQKREALGHSRADLTVSGRMLQDITIRPTQRTVTLGFKSGGGVATGGTFIQRSRAVGAATKAAAHHVTGVGPRRIRRPFFGLNDDDRAWVLSVVRARVRRVLR